MSSRDRFVDINGNRFDVGSKVHPIKNRIITDIGTIVGVERGVPLFQSEDQSQKPRAIEPNDLMVVQGPGYPLPVGERIARVSSTEENIQAVMFNYSQKSSSEKDAQTNVTAALPEWPGADAVYSYLYKVLEKMGAENWKSAVAQAKKRRTKPVPFEATDDMRDIIDALGKGDEERLKALQIKYKTSNYV